MVIPILIDTQDLSAEFNISQKDIESMIDNTIKSISLDFYNRWQQQASKNLKSTRSRYLDSLVYIDEGWMKGSVVLRDDDPIVMMLEEGASEYDLKESFAKSSKKKMKADGGWHLTIPMRYSTPSALGESEVFSGVLPQELYNKVKNADTYITIGGGKRSKGLTLDEIPTQYQEKTVRKAIPQSSLSKAREAYISKTSKFEGLVKIKDTTTGQTSGYMTFRRVSDKSDPKSWIHSGFDARNFAEKALAETESMIDQIVDVNIDNFLVNYLGQ